MNSWDVPIVRNLEPFHDKEHLAKQLTLIKTSSSDSTTTEAINRIAQEVMIPMNLDSTTQEVIKELKGKMCFAESPLTTRLSNIS